MKTNATESLERPGGRSNAVEITSYRPDFENPGVLPWEEAQSLKRERGPGIWFLNSIGKVHAPEDSEEFLKAIRRKQGEWYRHLSRQFGNGWRNVKKDEEDRWKVAYEYDGVVVVNGAILQFEWWKQQRLTNPAMKPTSRK